jgi:hypothetical protein
MQSVCEATCAPGRMIGRRASHHPCRRLRRRRSVCATPAAHEVRVRQTARLEATSELIRLFCTFLSARKLPKFAFLAVGTHEAFPRGGCTLEFWWKLVRGGFVRVCGTPVLPTKVVAIKIIVGICYRVFVILTQNVISNCAVKIIFLR